MKNEKRDRLIELVKQVPYGVSVGATFEQHFCEKIADCLIANGVTVQECGHWVSYQSDKPYGCMDDEEWYRCSKCGKNAHGRCYEDEWYSEPILSAYCPHCGVKMMPQPPKGE